MSSLGSPFFTGLFRHSLDDKNRLTIPSAWRPAKTKGKGKEDADAEKPVYLATANPDGYISVLPPDEVRKLHEKVAQVPMSDAAGQAQISAFFARAQAFSFDGQGRFAISDTLLKHAGLTKEVVLSGGLSKFNLYSPEKWAPVESKSDAESQADFMRRVGI